MKYETSPRPFEIRIPQASVERVLNQVASHRFPAGLSGKSWEGGVSSDFMRSICSYWIKDYQWGKTEAALNRFSQFKAQIDGFDIHFYHVRGSQPNSLPVVFTHGWPGSVFEFLDCIERLTQPELFGRPASESLTVVIPSLPGFGFSSKPMGEAIGPVSTAKLWHKLMTGVLGYERYGIQGGDLGCIVSTRLAHLFPKSAVGLHLNLVPPPPRPEMLEEEKAWSLKSEAFIAKELSYFQQQARKPETVSFALFDNPVGTAAWIFEKMMTWCDSQDGIAPPFTYDQMLSNLMIYLLTDTIDSSIWFYRGVLNETGGRSHPGGRISVPTGVADFPKDLLNGRPPRSLIESGFNLIHYTKMPQGGHFAALEQPALFCDDVLAFFGKATGATE